MLANPDTLFAEAYRTYRQTHYFKARLRGDATREHDDPDDRFHSTRAALRRHDRSNENVHDLYDHRLAVVDYRLACLRFAVGLPAVDDLYYRRPDDLPACLHLAGPGDFAGRLRRFDLAMRHLERHARWLDGLLECDWRTRDVSARRQRRDAIVRATQEQP